MAYIGKKPTDVPLSSADIADEIIDSDAYVDGSIDNAHIADDAIDSEHYAAGSIDEAHIANNAVTLAKMAGGTDGNIISYDTSGDPVAIATGNDGQVLTSSGANTQPAFEDAAGGGKLVQMVNDIDTAVATTTGVIAYDDTIPQIGEGGEFLSVAITPTNASNKLLIVVNCVMTITSVSSWGAVALFQDSTSNALASVFTFIPVSSSGSPETLVHYMAAGTTSATTFRVRLGTTTSTLTMNGSSGNRSHGGSCTSSITIMEIEV